MKKYFVYILLLLPCSTFAQNSDLWQKTSLEKTSSPRISNLKQTQQGYLFALTQNGVYRIHVDSLIWRKMYSFEGYIYEGKALETNGIHKIFALSKNELLRSFDNGSTWQKTSFNNVHGLASSLYYTSDKKLYVGKYDGSYETSYDDGDSFAKPVLFPFPFFSINGFVEKEQKIWVTGIGTSGGESTGSIAFSQNAGQTWFSFSAGRISITDIRLYFNNDIFVLSSGQLCWSNDNALFLLKDCHQDVSAFTISDKGVIYAGRKDVLYSSDGGKSWKSLNFSVTEGWINAIETDAKGNLFVSVTSDTQSLGIYRYKGVLPLPVATEPESALPTSISLAQNYPNPFNPSTTIHFSLPSAGTVKLEVFDVLGRSVGVLANGVFEAGQHEVQFDAKALPSGMYVVRLLQGNVMLTKSMNLVK